MSLSLSQIDQGIDVLLDNATALIAESDVLLSIGAYARAFALSHLAREELSRVTMLEAAAIRILAGHPVDWKRLMVRLKDHKSKLKQEVIENALFLKGAGLDDTADTAFQLAQGIANRRNELKNASLYVGLVDGRFTRPSELVSEHVARRTWELAALSLDLQRKIRSASPSYERRSTEVNLHLRQFDPEKVSEMIPEMAALYHQLIHALEPGNSGPDGRDTTAPDGGRADG